MTSTKAVSQLNEVRAAKIRAGLEQSIKGINDPAERLTKLYQLSMTLSGDPIDIFRHVAFMIGEMFDVRVVCLSEIRDEELYFISVYVDGEVTTDVGHCALDITPCATVGTTKDIRTYDEVIEKFPDAGFLKTHDAHSYCGFPALDSNGEVLAVTCLLDDKPHDFTEEDQNILRIFGQRIGFEIERQRELNAREHAVQAMQLSERHFRNIIELSNAVTWEYDVTNRRYIYVAPQAEELLGYPVDDWYQKGFLEKSMHPDDKALALEFYQTAIDQAHGGEFVYRLIDSTGEIVWVRDSVTVLEKGKKDYLVQGYMFNITPQKQAEMRVQELANFDLLTHLPNRAQLLERLQQSIESSEENGSFSVLIYMDLDRFKIVNDSLGYAVGDSLLLEISSKLKSLMGPGGTVARLGGDEFVVLLDRVSMVKEKAAVQARLVADKILKKIKVPYIIDGSELYVTASMGIAIFPEGQEKANDVLKHAHTAMNQIKSSQESIQFFLPDMQAAAEERMMLEGALYKALSLEEMSILYQPIIEIETNQILGCEALLRWEQVDGTIIEPTKFIPVAEETGEILPIGDWVMRQAASQFVEWQQSGIALTNMFVSVNVSPRQFQQPGFVDAVLQVIEDTGLSPSSLKLEITEGVILTDIDETKQKIVALKAHGITFAIDDFGTGYSSLSYLKELPLDSLKIDKSFINDAENNPDSLIIVETILSMARHLGLDVIAEGVETESIFEFLKQRQCYSYQGYYFSKPLTAEAFAEQPGLAD